MSTFLAVFTSDIWQVERTSQNIHTSAKLYVNIRKHLPPGFIENLGSTHATVLYVFICSDLSSQRKCSDISITDLKGVHIYEDNSNYIEIPIGIRRNVALFFVLLSVIQNLKLRTILNRDS